MFPLSAPTAVLPAISPLALLTSSTARDEVDRGPVCEGARGEPKCSEKGVRREEKRKVVGVHEGALLVAASTAQLVGAGKRHA